MLNIPSGGKAGRRVTSKACRRQRFVTFQDLPIITAIIAVAMVITYPSIDGSRTRYFRSHQKRASDMASFHLIDLISPAESLADSHQAPDEDEALQTPDFTDSMLIDFDYEASDRVIYHSRQSKHCHRFNRESESRSHASHEREVEAP